MTRRFAQDTFVPVSTSEAESKKRLREAGADQIAVFESADKALLAFTLHGRQYRLTVPIVTKAKDKAQEDRRAWRLMLLLLKAKLEAVREGATTIEREFMADLVMPNGQTMAEYIEPQISLAYERGAMPAALMLEGPK